MFIKELILKTVEKMIKKMIKSNDYYATEFTLHKNNCFEIMSYPSDIETKVFIELVFRNDTLLFTYWRHSAMNGLGDTKEREIDWYAFDLDIIEKVLESYLNKQLAYS